MEKDILIIGGGPSGLSTALHLVKLAPHLTDRILILEKEKYPRLKLCAGGLVLDAENILQALGLDASEVPHVDSETIHFDFAAKGLKIRVPKRHAIRVIRRDEFDHWLAKKTEERGVEIRQGVTVKKITPSEQGVLVETDQGNFNAAIVVGADGSNGMTRRSIFPKDPVYTARVLEVISPAYSPAHGNQEREHTAYFDFFPVPENIAGYVWDFPTQVHGIPMRCWGVYDTNLLADQKRPALKDPLAKEMQRLGFDLNAHEIKGHPIRWYSPQNKAAIPRVLLVGDAVGADVIFGEGISIALGYGNIAAREIVESLRRGEFSFRGYKRRLVRSGLGQTLFARWLVAQIIYTLKWRWFQFLLWRILQPVVIFVAWTFILNWSKKDLQH
ncbi:MAG: NAD(P)/FAD-dependent oxidoreductase [Anaerolineales bacterium]|jgi:flavin-dependent dehydrogenase|uniref:NAD(P)/FAD-dependent oxidoreductase n=1 Tax=Candidatus Villigracilis vicinus TaxID=3140679 RepID=UPI003135C2BB|nr:NAD(P)/FAD-dependent oxidoreductase [Anaerolineales bacterium]